jgi:phosphoglycerate dehydrogenase-like enzyme
MMKILLTRSLLPGDIQYLRDGLDKAIPGRYEFVIPSEFTEDALAALAPGADVLLGPFVTPKILAAATRLRLVQVPWTGMDTFDFAAMRGFSVPVCNTHSNADAVAELALALALDLLKKISYHDRKMRAGDWNRGQKPLDLKSSMLSRRHACVLGCGHIGGRIAALLSAFGARVVAVDPVASPGGPVAEAFSPERMAEAVAGAALVVCTLPLTDATRGSLGASFFGALPPGAAFVNVSRAAVVDEDALWDALSSGRLGGFAADVWWNAPKRGESQSYPSAKHPFWTLDNVVLSPHRAGFVDGELPHLDGAVANLAALEQGRPLSCVVDVSKGF